VKTLFADTAFYVALVSSRDELHERAVELAHGSRATIVTTEYVLVELGNRLARSGDKLAYLNVVRQAQSDRRTVIVWASRVLYEQALDLYAHRLDKRWSITDCTSFVIMQERGMVEALTTDHHFEQAGFVALLK